jgi:penicillin amidase
VISLATLRLAVELTPGLVRARRRAAGDESHPIVEGTLRMRGVEGRVEVIRDRHGLPHVFAASEPDALFGLGVVHAQDRLFQMDTMRRAGAGRLAEIAGSTALGSDRFMRRLGLARRAQEDRACTGAADLAWIEAYADGVNAGIASLPALPPEYELLGVAPEPWRAEDSMLVGRLVMYSFATNWLTELLRERLLRELGPDRAAALDPAYGTHRATHVGEPYPGSAERLAQAYEAAHRFAVPAGAASNAWAVNGTRSATGAPLLAADPHIEARLPGLFHASHVSGGSLNAIGADVAGVPGIAIGHNGHLAWGLTAGFADVADCFIETVDPADPRRYRTPSGWAEATERLERIEVRGGDPVELRVLETRHGPIVEGGVGQDRAIALRCTALEAGDVVSPFLGMLRARTVAEFRQALDRWHGATFGFVFAYVDGSIGQQLAGSVPRRAPGEGLLPTDGATSGGPAAIRGPEELPGQLDPPTGYVVSANNAPGATPSLGEEWCEPWRAERIRELIEARERHDVRSFQRIQVDRHSAALARFRDHLVAAAPRREPLIEMLRAWEGSLDPGNRAAAIVMGAYRDVARRLIERLGGRAGEIVTGDGPAGIGAQSSFDYRLQGWVLERLDRPCLPAFDGPEERDRMLLAALHRSTDRLVALHGDTPARWRLDGDRKLMLQHLLGPMPLVGAAFSRGPFSSGGDVNTVWQTSFPLSERRDDFSVAPAYRQVIDLGDFDRSTFQLLSGVSGIPGHPRHDDCTEEYLAGVSRPLLYSRAAVEAAAESKLAIEPAGVAA